MITERYRKDYTGEFVITESIWSGGKKKTKREWIPNPIQNHHISGRAACIGSSVDADQFDYTILTRHKGGLLGAKKLQTYGTVEIANSMRLDFVVERNEDKLVSLLNTHYYKDNIIYTSPKLCLKHPGVFYTIPYNPNLLPEVALIYLAAFDGHKEIFLLGYNEGANFGQNSWTSQIEQVIAAYPSTQFVHVGYESQTPESWKNYSNFSQKTYREFILYCDI